MLLDGKCALVTGASRGIGRAVALKLASEGAKVALNFAGNEAAANAVCEEIKSAGGQAILVKADVSDEAAVQQMVQTVAEAFGRIDILVNNAGITRDGLLARMKEEDWDAVLSTNLKGVFLTTKAATKLMMISHSWNSKVMRQLKMSSSPEESWTLPLPRERNYTTSVKPSRRKKTAERWTGQKRFTKSIPSLFPNPAFRIRQ